MKQALYWILPLILLHSSVSLKEPVIDSVGFFTDESLISMTLTTDIKKLKSEKKDDVFQEATVTMRFPDSTVIEEGITVAARGHFRRDFCNIPPMMVDFKTPNSPKLSALGKLKLVIGCGNGTDDEVLLLKEYLAYKIYNLLEEKSFRVRLMKVNYRDSRNKTKPFSQYAFLVEDLDDLAKRTGCIKKEKTQVLTESTSRNQMTMVAVFEYFISNGDWSVPNNHNVKLLWDKSNAAALPYPVPYDFDHSGFVNAGYALPNELLGTEKVTERVYRGFPRNMEELENCFDRFRKQKESIYSLIRNFPLLKDRVKRELIDFTDEFYNTINDKNQVKAIFIDNARRS
jgi:hypothetical protein